MYILIYNGNLTCWNLITIQKLVTWSKTEWKSVGFFFHQWSNSIRIRKHDMCTMKIYAIVKWNCKFYSLFHVQPFSFKSLIIFNQTLSFESFKFSIVKQLNHLKAWVDKSKCFMTSLELKFFLRILPN